jgi:hypothetical protein
MRWAMIGSTYLKRPAEKSYNDVPVGVLKSGIQKYVRRGMLEKGLWCLVELDLFRLLEAEPDGITEYVKRHGEADRFVVARRAKAMRTNLLNRLIVMVSEEINVAVWWMPLVVDRLAEAWKADRGRPESAKFLVDVYKYLMAARKIRLISDLKSVYLLPPDYVKPAQRRDLRVLHEGLLRSLGLSHLLAAGCPAVPERLLDGCTIDLNPFLGERTEERREIINGILHGLKHGSDRIFWWLGRLIDGCRDKKGEPRFAGRNDPLNAVWSLLMGFAQRREELWGGTAQVYPGNFGQVREILLVLKKWYETMTHRERPVYLYHAILLIVRRDQIDWSMQRPEIDTPWEEVKSLYDANLSGKRVELDEFVYDKHTGRKGRNSQARFAHEGALVVNEEHKFLNADYRSIYNGLKERLDVYERKGLAPFLETGGGEQ